MKVAFIIEYFPPFAPGGGEWSTFYLAKELVKQGVNVVVITPNLGAKKDEVLEGVRIRRFPFYLKPKGYNRLPGNFAFTNPLWLLWTTFYYFKLLRKENPDIINIHGKYSIPPVALANLILKKPLVASLRDYITVCNYGICLMKQDKACNLFEYFLDDFKIYWKIYVRKKNVLSFFANILFAFWGRISRNYLKFFVEQVNDLIVLSNKHKEIIYANHNNRGIKVIPNSYQFISLKNSIAGNNILFVGRLTYGKGVEILLDSITKVLKKYPNLTFNFVGQGYLDSKIKGKDGKIKLLGQQPHERVQELFKEAKLSVVPSIWPDPFPRVGLESISCGTPVVTTFGNGFSEIIEKNPYGYISEKNPDDLAKKIIEGVKNNRILRENIRNDYGKIKKAFSLGVANSYKSLYKELLKIKV